jgi:hypothetical protein
MPWWPRSGALGKPVFVHPYNRLSGAIGAALAAIEARRTTNATSVQGHRRHAAAVAALVRVQALARIVAK